MFELSQELGPRILFCSHCFEVSFQWAMTTRPITLGVEKMAGLSGINKVNWNQVGRVTEPGRYQYTFGWLTVGAEDVAIWEQYPNKRGDESAIRVTATIEAMRGFIVVIRRPTSSPIALSRAAPWALRRDLNPKIVELFPGSKLCSQPAWPLSASRPSFCRLRGISILRKHLRVRPPRVRFLSGGHSAMRLAKLAQPLLKPRLFGSYFVGQH
jgi:hypothetical protein